MSPEDEKSYCLVDICNPYKKEPMKKEICRNCGREIVNEFGVTLTFCTNCGAALSNLHAPQNAAASEKHAAQSEPQNRLFPTILLTSFLTALFLSALFALGF